MDEQGRSILVVEDDDAVRAVLDEILQSDGYQVRVASDGEVGLADALAHTPDLVLLDLMMPDKDGWSFLRERARHVTLATLPILVMSAGREDDLKRAKDLGANAYLAKPFDLDVLLALVHQLLEWPLRESPTRIDSVPGRGAIFISSHAS